MKVINITIIFLIFTAPSVFAADFDCEYWLKISKQRPDQSYSATYDDNFDDYQSYEEFSKKYLKKSFYDITIDDLNLWRKQIKECNFGGFLSTGKKKTTTSLYASLDDIQKKRESFEWGSDRDDAFISKYEKRVNKILSLPNEPSSLRNIQILFEDLDFYDGPRATEKRKQYIKDSKRRLSGKYKPIHDNQKYGKCIEQLNRMKISNNVLNKEIHSMNPKVQTIKDALCVAINGNSKIFFSKKNSKYILKIKNNRNNIHLYFTFYDQDKKLILTHMANPKTKWTVKELTEKNAQYILANYYGIAKE